MSTQKQRARYRKDANMATLEDRLKVLEGDYAAAMQAVALKLDEHAATQREQGRDIRELGRDMREQGRDMREVKTRLATMDTRLNRLDEKFDTLKEEINQKFEQVIALLLPKNPGA
jgi:DNA-binding ferritin-like protein (Dps family)